MENRKAIGEDGAWGVSKVGELNLNLNLNLSQTGNVGR